ncbi:TolC family protein [Sphingobacterium spiritivorum]|uniref:Outer membrane efflux protein n=1 Tax=Sphingobacterium spiritivorum ATCC 33861 TaxID=525373 RepID=D7VQ22_SPHSI|nr:TolC family protein [Sphingobacterium spiritivorum]EFK55873.1 outer membrane efflux protein [Sphingobacterium spiritivorum ATCC 33861]QQT35989.1 TolC family protein [Sphingobacterium spiritivorum]WQD32719.1 TolC family protein [Sphingobacterium spiritivorum]SUJ14034.1 outer membrane channel protein [Sphingobacterium spiritivorum]
MKFFNTGRLALSILLTGFVTVSSQAQEVLDAYVLEAFRNNIVLQQKDVTLEKAQYALKTAKSLFLPTVAFQGAYQTADGGRNIPLPLGDLLNPIYTTLNQLTQSSQFPVMENQSINFLPKNFYDAKIRTTMPIINTDLTYNKRISEQQVVLQQFEVVIYKRDLVKNIKTAYYNYQSALQAVDIYRSGLQLANEGLRVNEKLLEGGKGLPAYVLRSRSEVEQANAQLVAAEQQVLNARMYFNFLLNRNAETNIDADTDNKAGLDKVSTLLADLSQSEKREELKAMDQIVEINRTALKMNKQYAVPKLAAFVDLGSQSEGFKFNNNTRYYMLGLQLDIPIFTAGRNDIKVRQSNLDLRNAELQVDLVSQQLNLATRTAQNNLKAVYQNYQSSLKQFEAASSYQRLIEKGYKAGTNTFIETIDARNQYTSAQLLVNINRYKVLAAMADLERETASYLIH